MQNVDFKSEINVNDLVSIAWIGCAVVTEVNDNNFKLELKQKGIILKSLFGKRVYTDKYCVGVVSSVRNGVINCISIK